MRCFYVLKLGKRFNQRFPRYILLEWIRRNQNDEKTYGELFFMFCNDIRDMDLTNALQGLMALFSNIATVAATEIAEMLESKVSVWMASQPLFTGIMVFCRFMIKCKLWPKEAV